MEDVTAHKPAPEGLLKIAAAAGGASSGTSATPWTTRAAPGPRPCRSSASPRRNSPRRAELAALFQAENAVAILDDINQLESVLV
jgi:hypothetical protein